MKDANRSPVKIAVSVLALSLFLCVFVSCQSEQPVLVLKNGETSQEITRGVEPIYAPIYNETEFHGDATTDPAATKTNTPVTTDPAATKHNNGQGNASTSPASSAPPVTFKNASENEAVSRAAAASGTNANDIAQFISIMGYDYDPNQDIFYTSMDNWQRQGNFVSHYDTAARYINMYYRTVTIDFGTFDGLDWRMQLWKGQYGVFGGCEAGIYTKDPDKNNMLYHAADDYHMLQWESALYLSKEDYAAGKKWFYREWQSHWWLTGFKSGVVDPEKLIMYLRVRMNTRDMANMFEEAMLNTGFRKVSSTEALGYDTFKRSMNDFYILWDQIGKLNYSERTN